jgi:hypothetical protein
MPDSVRIIFTRDARSGDERDPKMRCAECERLRVELESYRELMDAAKDAMRERVEAASTEEYKRLFIAKSDAWLEYDLAYRRLKRHLMVHADED